MVAAPCSRGAGLEEGVQPSPDLCGCAVQAARGHLCTMVCVEPPKLCFGCSQSRFQYMYPSILIDLFPLFYMTAFWSRRVASRCPHSGVRSPRIGAAPALRCRGAERTTAGPAQHSRTPALAVSRTSCFFPSCSTQRSRILSACLLFFCTLPRCPGRQRDLGD